MGTVLQLQMDKGRKTPRTDNGKDESSAAGKDGLPPPRRYNADVRSREYLTPDEAESLIAAAVKVGRHSHRTAR